jgi:diaminohydroxyphosphoribosylaminopyrimidine deaminase/5-amino-6-(5-phosphoribosylamino)uracil reductase
MRQALRLARRGYGRTSPNPMVGAVIVQRGKIVGKGWHRKAGGPHAEVEALNDAARRGAPTRGATLYVTLEPCSTHGRTPPCVDAIKAASIKRVVVAATDPNPGHAGRAFRLLKRSGITVETGILSEAAEGLNEAFNHWICAKTPFVTVKAAMTLDGKIATASGESKWITSEKSRAHAMGLRAGSDAILVGINTVLADDPSLTARAASAGAKSQPSRLRRIILDSRARTPLNARVVTDDSAGLTTIVVTSAAAKKRVAALSKLVSIIIAPARDGRIDLRWLMRALGKQSVASLLVEGGGEVNASFLETGLAQRVAFFYAPKILGGRDSLTGVAGKGATRLADLIHLENISWRQLGCDLLLTGRVRKNARRS